ncbi:MAG TPA: VOC family protein [Myxococcales bacterium]
MPAIAEVRFARPVADLAAALRFYRDGLGLPVLGGFEGHAGYDGVMVGLPGADWHLELTTCPGRPPSAAPGPEELLVLYYPEPADRDAAVARLASLGFEPVAPENPYWIGRAVTVPDPDGFRVVLFAGRFRSLRSFS